MKRLAIISSYKEQCGNATYTEVLKKGFSKHYHVDVLTLNTSLLRSDTSIMKRLAEKHIDELASKLSAYDYVNIQFEAGLFGIFPWHVLSRVKRLLKASKNVIVTLHQFHEKTSFFGKSFIKKLLSAKFKLIFLETLRTLKKNRQAKMCHQLMHLLKAEGASLVVHTPREAEFLRQFYDFTRVHHHPISFLSVSDYHDYRAKMDPAAFRKQYGLGPGEIGIGLFGFISEYKGHHTAIKALKYLPKEYKMLFFGGQHPHSILPYTRIDPYLEELENLATTHEVADRIIFCSSLNDEEFIQALLCCDMTILPYMEVGQSGSGVAALTLELRVKALFSQNFAFLELEKYAENAIEKVSIGCALELASKLKNLAISEENSRKMALEKYHQTYNLDSNVDLYKRIFEGIEPSNNG